MFTLFPNTILRIPYMRKALCLIESITHFAGKYKVVTIRLERGTMEINVDKFKTLKHMDHSLARAQPKQHTLFFISSVLSGL